jgi:hypothetical protein
MTGALCTAAPAAAAPHANGSRPDRPTSLAISPCHQRCASPALTSASSPRLTATVTDPDGGNLREVVFEVWNADHSTLVQSSAGTVTNVLSGTSESWQPELPEVDAATYTWRVRGCDVEGCGHWSGWFTVTTDTVNPDAPTVTSTDYPSGQYAGGPGVPGVFHFGTNGSTDVTGFLWSLDREPPGTSVAVGADGTADVTVTPETDFSHRLYVQSVDAAGNVSDVVTYSFLVTPPPNTVGTWPLDDGTGTTAVDSSGLGHDLTLHGGATWVPGHVGTGAVETDGGYLTADAPLLDTRRGFTVAGWAYLTDLSRDQVVLAEDGGFALAYRAGCGCWSFEMPDAGGTPVAARSDGPVAAGTWIHLAGVYDTAAHQLRIAVNGAFQPTMPAYSGQPVATGVLTAGAVVRDGQPADALTGDLDALGAYPRVLGDSEIVMLAHADEA